MMHLSKVEKTFTGKYTLSDVSLDLQVGKVSAICGLNACGKTTLLRIISGVVCPDAGYVEFNADQIRIGYLPQDPLAALMPWYRAYRNVVIAANGTLSRKGATDRLEDFGLDNEMAFQYPLQLSGGYQQRLAWACATCESNNIIVLDEPFANQDMRGTKLLVSNILDMRKSRAASIILTVHDLEIAVICADQVLILGEHKDGQSSLRGVEEIALDDNLRTMDHVTHPSVLRYVERIASRIYSEQH